MNGQMNGYYVLVTVVRCYEDSKESIGPALTEIAIQ